MRFMQEWFPFERELPRAAEPAVAIVRDLVAAGHQALLAGGCVRDLLLGQEPADYDVVTDAPPHRVQQLFRVTRLVGAQFGVVLVRKRRRWVEVATFRADGPYLDGRHPVQVVFSDAREDARRRDFTVNGLFLDPLRRQVADFVGGRADLEAKLIRAIGEPSARFHEDHLRLIRAVRFAARLGFEIEPATFAAMQQNAELLADVAPERVREELERILTHPSRQRAFGLLVESGLLPYLCRKMRWTPVQAERTGRLLGRLPAEASFELAMAAMLADRALEEIHSIGRALTLSNEQRERTAWLVEHQADLDEPQKLPLSALKRLMAHPAFEWLCQLAVARADEKESEALAAALAERLATIAPESVEPPPLVTGDDLLARGVPQGPVYREILEALYTQQLDEKIRSREQALAVLEQMVREKSAAGGEGRC
jgi:poly(A) polymerase